MAGEEKPKRRFSPARLLWPLLALIAGFAFIFFAYGALQGFNEKSKTSIQDGKRVTIEISSGKIEIAPSLAEREKAVEEAKQKAEAETKAAAENAKAKPDHKAEVAAEVKEADIPTTKTTLPTLKPKLFTGKIAVLVTGIGLNRDWTKAALELPGNIALSISPYTVDVATLAGDVAKAKHTIFMDLPTESHDYPYSDPGPYALLLDATEGQNMFRLQTLLNMVKDLQGVYFSPNDRITEDEETIVPVLDRLAQQKKAMVFASTDTSKFVADQARALGIAHISSYLQLDAMASTDVLDSRIQQLYEHINGNKGDLLLVMRAYPGSVERLKRFLHDFNSTGYKLAPITDVLIK